MGANQSWWTDGTTAAQPRTRGPRGTRPPLLTDGADPQSRGVLSPGGVPTPGHRREGPRVSCAPQFRHALQALPPRTRDNPQPPGHPPKCPHAQQTRSLGRDSAANPPTPAPSTRVLSLTRVDTWDLHKTTLPLHLTNGGRCPGSHLQDTEAGPDRTEAGGSAVGAGAQPHTLGAPPWALPAQAPFVFLPHAVQRAFRLPGGGWGRVEVEQRAKPLAPPPRQGGPSS